MTGSERRGSLLWQHAGNYLQASLCCRGPPLGSCRTNTTTNRPLGPGPWMLMWRESQLMHIAHEQKDDWTLAAASGYCGATHTCIDAGLYFVSWLSLLKVLQHSHNDKSLLNKMLSIHPAYQLVFMTGRRGCQSYNTLSWCTKEGTQICKLVSIKVLPNLLCTFICLNVREFSCSIRNNDEPRFGELNS